MGKALEIFGAILAVGATIVGFAAIVLLPGPSAVNFGFGLLDGLIIALGLVIWLGADLVNDLP